MSARVLGNMSELLRFIVPVFRSTLVSKEPDSMLAHMFRGKGKAFFFFTLFVKHLFMKPIG